MCDAIDLLSPGTQSILRFEGINTIEDLHKYVDQFDSVQWAFRVMSGIGPKRIKEIELLLDNKITSPCEVLPILKQEKDKTASANAQSELFKKDAVYFRDRYEQVLERYKTCHRQFEELAGLVNAKPSNDAYVNYLKVKLADHDIPYVSLEEYQAIQSGEL